MKIYTKTGDDGTTGLQGNVRLSKSAPRIAAYGAVDEANALLGIVLSHQLDNDIEADLVKIQNELFVVGSDLSNPDMTVSKNRVVVDMIKNLEQMIDKYESELTILSNFILPGGVTEAAYLHLTRSVVRRAETKIVLLQEKDKVNNNVLRYVNRLSDLLFVLARTVNKRKGVFENIWKPQ